MPDPSPYEQIQAADLAPRRLSHRAAIAVAGVQVAAAAALVVALVVGDEAPEPIATASDAAPSTATEVEDALDAALDDGASADSEPAFVEVDPASLPEPVLSGALDDEQVDAGAFATFARSTVAWVCGWDDRSAVAVFDQYGDAGMQVLADQTAIDSRPLAELGYDETALTGVRHVAAAYAYRVDGGFQVDLSPRDGVDASAFVPASPACS